MVRKLIITLILSGLLLTACNMPTTAITPDLDQVATIVEMTLTSQAQFTQPSSTQDVVTSTETIPAVIITPTPTETIEPSPSMTSTPTVPPTGFKETLGLPDWQDVFANGNSFGLDAAGYEDDNTKIIIYNGAMVLSNSSVYGYRGWRLTSKSPDDIYIEGKFNVQSCAGDDLYGLVFRAPDYSSGYGYYLGVTCNGKYNVTKWDTNGTSTILNSTADPSIKAGANQVNDIGIQNTGNTFTIYINNTMVTQFTDTTFPNGGHFGVFIAGQSPGAFTVRVEELAYWSLP